MDFIAGALIIIVILLCLGAGVSDIMMIALGTLCAGMATIALFFLFCASIAICGSRTDARFSHFEKGKHGFDCAIYDIDGVSYPNAFPCEVVMRERIYRSDKTVRVLINKKKGVVFDKNAISAIIVGIAVCVPAGAFAIFCAVNFLHPI